MRRLAWLAGACALVAGAASPVASAGSAAPAPTTIAGLISGLYVARFSLESTASSVYAEVQIFDGELRPAVGVCDRTTVRVDEGAATWSAFERYVSTMEGADVPALYGSWTLGTNALDVLLRDSVSHVAPRYRGEADAIDRLLHGATRSWLSAVAGYRSAIAAARAHHCAGIATHPLPYATQAIRASDQALGDLTVLLEHLTSLG